VENNLSFGAFAAFSFSSGKAIRHKEWLAVVAVAVVMSGYDVAMKKGSSCNPMQKNDLLRWRCLDAMLLWKREVIGHLLRIK
jgi:hypothetical protein